MKQNLDISEVQDKHNVVVQIGYNHRYHPAISKAKTMVDNNDIGEIMYINALYGHGGAHEERDGWRLNPSISGGGDLIDKGCHIIDLSAWFFGDSLFSKSNGVVKNYYRDKIDDNSFLVLQTTSGQTAFLQSSCTEWINTFRFSIYGKLGKLESQGVQPQQPQQPAQPEIDLKTTMEMYGVDENMATAIMEARSKGFKEEEIMNFLNGGNQ